MQQPSQSPSFLCRKAIPEDIPLLREFRKQQLIDEGSDPSQDIDAAVDAFLRSKMMDGSLVQLLAEDQGETVATGGIVFYPFPPCFENPSGSRGYIMSMYTRPSHRGRGLATTLLKELTLEARSRGVSYLFLGASSMGRPVYERFGFQPAGSLMEMELEP